MTPQGKDTYKISVEPGTEKILPRDSNEGIRKGCKEDGMQESEINIPFVQFGDTKRQAPVTMQ